MVDRPVTNLRNNFDLLGGDYYRDGIPISPAEVTIVRSAEDLSGPLSSTKVYLVDGAIDMGSQSIVVPQNGLNISGHGFSVSSLSSSEDGYTLFVDDGTYSGDLFVTGMDILVTGSGSKVFDLDNAENQDAVEMVSVNFVNCGSLGDLANYRQGLWTNVALIGCVDGQTMIGTWSGGFASLTSIIVGAPTPTFTGTLFKAGAGLTIQGSFRSDMNALGLNDAGTFCDFAPSNIANNAGFFMAGVRVNPSADAFPNMPASSIKARFTGCTGTDNTYIGGQWVVTAQTVTSIAAANTPVKLAGTTTYADMQWFSNTTNNAFVYDGTQEIGIVVHGTLSLTGNSLDEINLVVRQWDNSASSYIDLSESGAVTMNAAGRAEGVTVLAFGTFAQNDRLEIWVENQTSSMNVTALLGGLVSISERPS